MTKLVIESEVSARCHHFMRQIMDAISNEKWDDLNSILKVRQDYFEEILKDPIQTLSVDYLEKLIADVLHQDQQFVLTIHQKQQAIEQQRLSLMQGRRSVKAYAQ